MPRPSAGSLSVTANLYYSYRGYTRRFGQNTKFIDAAKDLDEWIRTGPKPDDTVG